MPKKSLEEREVEDSKSFTFRRKAVVERLDSGRWREKVFKRVFKREPHARFT